MNELLQRIGLPLFVQTVIEVFNEIILLMLISTMLIGVRKDKNSDHIRTSKIPLSQELILFYISVFLYNLCNIFGICTEFLTDLLPRMLFSISTFFYYVIGGMQTLLFLQVIKKYIAEKNNMSRLKKAIFICQIVQLFMFVLLLITPFTDLLYYIDSSNEYQRADGYWIWYGLTMMIFIFMSIVLILCFKKMDSFLKKIIITAAVFPMIAFIFGFFFNELSPNNIMVAVSALVMFVVYENNKTRIVVENIKRAEKLKEKLYERNLELEKSKLNLLMAQIKPHFINNAMTAVSELCYEEPEKAAELIKHFSLYLRSSMNAIGAEMPILFEKELEAVKEYLAIEYADTSKKFRFRFDLQTIDFMVPALSIEPLAENAVKHGIDRYSESSEVVLSTYEDEADYHVVIRDNGEGFELNAETLGKGGVGFTNAKKRLKIMCDGRLDITREDGWTVAHIFIPKERKDRIYADDNDR